MNCGARNSTPTRDAKNTVKVSIPQTENKDTAMEQDAHRAHASNGPSTAAIPKANAVPTAHATMPAAMPWKKVRQNVHKDTSREEGISHEDTSHEAISQEKVDTNSAAISHGKEDSSAREDISQERTATNPVRAISHEKEDSNPVREDSSSVKDTNPVDSSPVEVINSEADTNNEENISPVEVINSAAVTSNVVEAMASSAPATVRVASALRAMIQTQSTASRSA